MQAERRPRAALARGRAAGRQVEVGEHVAVEGEEAVVEVGRRARRRQSGSRPRCRAARARPRSGSRPRPAPPRRPAPRAARRAGSRRRARPRSRRARPATRSCRRGRGGRPGSAPASARSRSAAAAAFPRRRLGRSPALLGAVRRGNGALDGPADALVLEAGAPGAGWVEEVAAVDQQRPRHPLRGGGPVELGELGPLGDQHRRVGAVERLQRRVAELDRSSSPRRPSAATGS